MTLENLWHIGSFPIAGYRVWVRKRNPAVFPFPIRNHLYSFRVNQPRKKGLRHYLKDVRFSGIPRLNRQEMPP